MFTLVLAVFCLSVPYALAGDEHPWDEEGGGGLGGGDSTPPPDDGDGLQTINPLDSERVVGEESTTIETVIKIVYTISLAI